MLFRSEETLVLRFNQFCQNVQIELSVKQPFDLASEILCFYDPDQYWLWSMWMYEPKKFTGALTLVLDDGKILEKPTYGSQYLMIGSAIEEIDKIAPSAPSTIDIKTFSKNCYKALNDDLNTPVLISHLFDGIRQVHQVREGKASLTEADLKTLKGLYHTLVFDILGLQKSESKESEGKFTPKLIELILKIRQEAKNNKDFETSDRIREALNELGVEVKDSKEGFSWSLK